MSNRHPASHAKRQREIAKQAKRREKEQKRDQRRDERTAGTQEGVAADVQHEATAATDLGGGAEVSARVPG